MDAIIGRYKVRMEDSGLVLTHPAGINFDLTPDEVMGLLDIIKVYRQAFSTRERETNPALERIVTEEDQN